MESNNLDNNNGRGFFVITSDETDRVCDSFYGYAIIGDDFVAAPAKVDYDSLSGNGCYVGIERKEKEIILHQDFMGCYGIYRYEDGNGYFAFSNSFLYLYEYLIQKGIQLTTDQDYINYMITAELASLSYDHTPVKEITLLDRSARIHISVRTPKYKIEKLDYKENTIAPDSPEGIALLDQWFERWAGLFRKIALQTSNISVDLSGGFDTRLTFALFFKAGVDMNRIITYSIVDGKHTHSEDLQIAKQIAETLHFPLNNWKNQSNERIPYTLKEQLDQSLYTKLFFHKQLYYKPGLFTQMKFHVMGNGGECIRAYWRMKPKTLVQKNVYRALNYTSGQDRDFAESTRRILEDSVEKTRKKFRDRGVAIPEREIPRFLYRETRGRNHFGRGMAESFQSYEVVLAPLLDPDLHKLKTGFETCGDSDLLASLIFERYAPELLDFPFEGGRKIKEETIQTAKKVNASNPYRNIYLEKEPVFAESWHANKVNQKYFTAPEREQFIFNAFRSPSVGEIMAHEFPPMIYDNILKSYEEKDYFPISDCYTVLGAAKIVTDQEVISAESFCPHVCMSDYLGELNRQWFVNRSCSTESSSSGESISVAARAKRISNRALQKIVLYVSEHI